MNSSNKKEPQQSINADSNSIIKNVIQAVIHLPAWAWVIGTVVISIGLCCAFGGAAAILNPASVLQFIPTQPAFPTATPEQSLIIVADFDDRSDGKYTGLDPAQYIYEQLSMQISKNKMDIRVERLSQVVNDNTVYSLGENYNATLVVWGWYDVLTITPRITRVKPLLGNISDQEGVRFSLADPNKVELSVIRDLPSQTNYLVLFTLGIDKYSNNQFDEALQYFNNALQVAANDPSASINPSEIFFYRGYIYSTKKDCSSAISNYSYAINLNPSIASAYNNRGVCFSRNYDFIHAIADYSAAIKINPNWDLPYKNRGDSYTAYKSSYEQAIMDYNKAIEINPNDAYTYLGRGNVYNGISDYDAANADFDKALELADKDNYILRAHAYIGKSEYKLAITEATMAINLSPNEYYGYIVRGSALNNNHEYELAIADIKKALMLDQNNAYTAYTNLGFIYSNNGEYELAIAELSKAIEINPYSPNLYISLGYAYTGNGDFEQAIANYDIAIQLNPDTAYYAYNNAGFLSTLTLDLEKAILYLEKAWSISPQLLTLLNLGDAYLLSGNIDQAIIYQKDALSIIETNGVNQSKAIQGVWLYNYLPIQKNDTATIQNHVVVSELNEKKVFVHYNLGFGYALTKKIDLANEEFKIANQLDKNKEYDDYFIYKIRTIENLVQMDKTTMQWFETQREKLGE